MLVYIACVPCDALVALLAFRAGFACLALLTRSLLRSFARLSGHLLLADLLSRSLACFPQCGLPEILVVDQQTSLVGKELQKFALSYGIDLLPMPPNAKEKNAVAERAIR